MKENKSLIHSPSHVPMRMSSDIVIDLYQLKKILRTHRMLSVVQCQYEWGGRTRRPFGPRLSDILCPHLLYSATSHVALTKYSIVHNRISS
jgi:hypothetical protein